MVLIGSEKSGERGQGSPADEAKRGLCGSGSFGPETDEVEEEEGWREAQQYY